MCVRTREYVHIGAFKYLAKIVVGHSYIIPACET
jgi:hypothetical protein